MKILLSKGKLPELKSIDFDMCESYILGKQKNVSFLKTGRTPKAEKLELVHTDLWGPSVPMEFRLPEEVWSGKEVKFSPLKVSNTLHLFFKK